MTVENQILELVKKTDPDNPIAFVKNIVKPMACDKLNEAIKSCEDCEIGCNNAVKTITKGNPNASIMIIGESVSLDQIESGELINYPLEDSAGRYLQEMLDYLQVNENEIFYINSVNCFPQRNGNKRASTVAERSACKTFLDYAINLVEPLMIICLGAVAVNGINEEIGKQNIRDIRGNYFMYRGINVMPTYHPGYFIELGGKIPDDLIAEYYKQFQNDIEKAFVDVDEFFPEIGILGGK